MDRSSTGTRLLLLVLAVAILTMLLLACDDPQCKRWHISIKEVATQEKAMLYCDDYEWSENRDQITLIGCSGHSGTVTKDIAPGDVVVIESFVCVD